GRSGRSEDRPLSGGRRIPCAKRYLHASRRGAVRRNGGGSRSDLPLARGEVRHQDWGRPGAAGGTRGQELPGAGYRRWRRDRGVNRAHAEREFLTLAVEYARRDDHVGTPIEPRWLGYSQGSCPIVALLTYSGGGGNVATRELADHPRSL